MGYGITSSETQIENCGMATVYGVCFGEEAILDISSNKETVLRIVEKLNEFEVSTIHVHDVIRDLLE